MSSQRIVLLLFPMVLAAQPAWRVTSGGVEYRLERSTAGIAWSYFGPEWEKPWAAPSSEMEGLVESQSLIVDPKGAFRKGGYPQSCRRRLWKSGSPGAVDGRPLA